MPTRAACLVGTLLSAPDESSRSGPPAYRRGRMVGAILIVAFNEASVAFFGASEINILGTGLIMVLTLMYFPNGIVGTLAHKNKLPRFLNRD